MSNERRSLLSGKEHNKPQTKNKPVAASTKHKNGVLFPAFIIFMVLMAYGYDYYLLKCVKDLKASLALTNEQVSDQQKIINRFNNSVSNQDVLNEVKVLEASLAEAKASFEQSLLDTENKVEQELSNTVTKLDNTVATAENQITAQVDKVKNDVNNYVAYTNNQFSQENNFLIYQLAGTFTLLSGLISMWHITSHLRNFYQPAVQRKILVILWMSPLYGITSWLSLVFAGAEEYLAIIRDCYEAYAIYMFLSFLISVLGRGDRERTIEVLAEQGKEHLPQPMRCCCSRKEPELTPIQLASKVLFQCQMSTMQFVLLKPFTSIASFVLANFYGFPVTNNDYTSPQFYIFLAENISIFMAFSGLIKFYHAVESELGWCKPLPKFLCIKGVVFMTFWQGLAIGLLAESTGGGVEDDTTETTGYKADPSEWARMAQNFLICLEMLLFSIAHFYVFPTEEWHPDYRPSVSRAKFGDKLALRDFFQDVRLLLGGGDDLGKRKDELLHKIQDLEANFDGDSSQVSQDVESNNNPFLEESRARVESPVCTQTYANESTGLLASSASNGGNKNYIGQKVDEDDSSKSSSKSGKIADALSTSIGASVINGKEQMMNLESKGDNETHNVLIDNDDSTRASSDKEKDSDLTIASTRTSTNIKFDTSVNIEPTCGIISSFAGSTNDNLTATNLVREETRKTLDDSHSGFSLSSEEQLEALQLLTLEGNVSSFSSPQVQRNVEDSPATSKNISSSVDLHSKKEDYISKNTVANAAKSTASISSSIYAQEREDEKDSSSVNDFGSLPTTSKMEEYIAASQNYASSLKETSDNEDIDGNKSEMTLFVDSNSVEQIRETTSTNLPEGTDDDSFFSIVEANTSVRK